MLDFDICRASTCNTCTARYCCTNSVLCPSDAGTVSKRMDMSSRFLTFWYGNYSIVFSALQNFQGNPLSDGVKYTGWENFCKYRLYFDNRTRYAHSYTNTKSWVADRSVFVLVTFSDLERRDGKGQTFLEDLHNYTSTV